MSATSSPNEAPSATKLLKWVYGGRPSSLHGDPLGADPPLEPSHFKGSWRPQSPEHPNGYRLASEEQLQTLKLCQICQARVERGSQPKAEKPAKAPKAAKPEKAPKVEKPAKGNGVTVSHQEPTPAAAGTRAEKQAKAKASRKSGAKKEAHISNLESALAASLKQREAEAVAS